MLIEDTESTEWAVQVGCEDRWHFCTAWESDRAAVVERLRWMQSCAAPSVTYRLGCRRTSTTVTVESI